MIQININPEDSIAFLGDVHADSLTPSSRIDNYMETCKNKLKDVAEKCEQRNVKHLFIAGDIFSRITTTHEAVNEIGEAFKEFKNRGIEVYTIIGNHDMVRNSTDNFQKSPLQTLISFGVLRHIHQGDEVCLGDYVVIHPVDYTEYPNKVERDGRVHILLAHMFYNASSLIADERHNLSTDVMKSLGYDAAFLGHDHEEYGENWAGKCVIFRTGSMTRGTSHSYNFNRHPKFLVLKNVGKLKEGFGTAEKVEIAHKPFEDIVSAVVNSKKVLEGEYDLKGVLSNLASKLSEGTNNTTDRILEIIKTDENLSAECRALLMKYIAEEA